MKSEDYINNVENNLLVEHVGGRLFSLPMLIKTGKELGSFDLGGQFVSDCHIDVMSLLDKLKLNVWCRPCMSGKIIRSVKNGSFDTTNFYNELTDKLWSFKYFEEESKAHILFFLLLISNFTD